MPVPAGCAAEEEAAASGEGVVAVDSPAGRARAELVLGASAVGPSGHRRGQTVAAPADVTPPTGSGELSEELEADYGPDSPAAKPPVEDDAPDSAG